MEVTPASDATLAQAVAWHRQVAAMVAAAERAGVAQDELPAVRARLAAQEAPLGQLAARLGAPLPALVPSPAEIATAGATWGDLSTAAITGATRTMTSTLDAVDMALQAALGGGVGDGADLQATPPAVPRQLGPVATRTGRGVGLRNAAIYAAYATVVLIVQVVLFLVLDEASGLPLAAPLCLFVFPVLAWVAGWLSIGAAFPPGEDGEQERSPRLGAAVCMVPNLLLCGVFVLFFLGDRLAG